MELVIAIAAALGVTLAMFEGFRRTSHGPNNWTVDGFIGMLFCAPYIRAAAATVSGSWSSAFRSPAVQVALYDSKRKDPAQWAIVVASAHKAGVAVEDYVRRVTTQGRHMRGLAADIVPGGGMTVQQAAPILFAAAREGKLGPVKKVLDEINHVHMEWWAPWGEKIEPPVLEVVS